MLPLIFLARRIQPFFSLVERKVQFCVLTNYSFSTFNYFFVRKNLSSCDCTEIRTHVPTPEDFEVTESTIGATGLKQVCACPPSVVESEKDWSDRRGSLNLAA